METSSLLLGILLLFTFVGPMIYLAVNQNTREKKKRKNLILLSQRNQAQLDETEYLSPVSLGLDKTSKKLVVIHQFKPRKEIALDLKEVKSCRLLKLTSENTPSESLDEVQEILLLLQTASGAEESIPFYQDEHDSAAERELRLTAASKWQVLISDNLKK